MKAEAEKTVKNSLLFNTRPGMDKVPEIGSPIDVVISNEWVPGWRMAGMLGSNVIAEHDSKFKKLHLTQIRPSENKLWSPSQTNDPSSSSPNSASWCFDADVDTQFDNCWRLGPKEEVIGGCFHGVHAAWPHLNRNLNIFNSHDLFSGCDESALHTVFDEKTVKGESSNTGSEEDYGPSRLPPKFYLKDQLCIEAIIAEINGLVKKNAAGKPL